MDPFVRLIRQAQFTQSAPTLKQCPPDTGMEVAFAGRLCPRFVPCRRSNSAVALLRCPTVATGPLLPVATVCRAGGGGCCWPSVARREQGGQLVGAKPHKRYNPRLPGFG